MKIKWQLAERLIWLTLLLAVFFIQLDIGQLSNRALAKENVEDEYYFEIFSQVLGDIRNQYIDKDKATLKVLIYGAIKGMLAELDDVHSSFLDSDINEELTSETKGSFSGIGINIRIKDGNLIILNPMEGSPAFKVGIKPGDVIVKIEGKPTENMTLDKAKEYLRGKEGEAVNLSILREPSKKLIDFKIVRTKIEIKSITFDKIKGTDTGYVKIRNFSLTTATDLENALISLSKKNITGLILDLRYNPGGLLESACQAVDLFIDKGQIAFTKNRYDEVVQNFQAQEGTSLPLSIPLIILVNEYSASASEILAGSLQDHKRAILVGEKTFGKFSVQIKKDIHPKDKTAYKLTTAYYYIPSGRSLHNEGIEPDIHVPSQFLTSYEENIFSDEEWTDKINQFIKKNDNLTEEEIKLALDKNLSSQGINLTPNTLAFIVHQVKNEKEEPPLYDVAFDDQLKEALKILKGHTLLKSK